MYALANPVQPFHSARLRLPRATKLQSMAYCFSKPEDISLLSSAYADDLQLVTNYARTEPVPPRPLRQFFALD